MGNSTHDAVRSLTWLGMMVVALSGCLDRSDTYENLDAAREGRVFEKGWLPDLLPPSAHDLQVVTTVEDSTGRGRFRLDPYDYPEFARSLTKFDGVLSKDRRDRERMRVLIGEGFEPHSLDGRATWVFLCTKDHALCEFFVWP